MLYLENAPDRIVFRISIIVKYNSLFFKDRLIAHSHGINGIVKAMNFILERFLSLRSTQMRLDTSKKYLSLLKILTGTRVFMKTNKRMQ